MREREAGPGAVPRCPVMTARAGKLARRRRAMTAIVPIAVSGVPEAAGEEALRCEPGDVVGLAECLRVAATLEESEYARRARSTRETLLPRLRGPEFYAQAYRELGGS